MATDLDSPPDADFYHDIAATLHRQGRAVNSIPYYRAALALEPERADTWSNLGLAALTAGRAEDAVQCERTALHLDPFDPEAHNNLGIVLHAMHALAEAENHFRGALRLAPNHANATLNLGAIRQTLGRPAEAEALYRRARDLGCDAAKVNNNLALALAEQDRLDEAEIAGRDARRARPDYPEAEVNLALILLTRGRLQEAWPLYEARWRILPLSDRPGLPAETRWTGGGDLSGKTILLTAEQGFGDTLQFCRYVPMVAALGARVLLAVPPGLERLMATLPGASAVVGQDDPLPAFDLHCPLMSLPVAFGTESNTIPARVPYLRADPAAATLWANAIPHTSDTSAGVPGGLRIGLVWAGARRMDQPHAAAVDKRRSLPLTVLAPLAAVPGCVFVSLQLGPPARQLRTAPFPVIDVAERLTDFAATAALIETLDLVISADTAVAHLAGALGKPVWVLNRFDACWRWPRDRDDTPWYPTMRLFRQAQPGDWAGVVERVAAALRRFRVLS